MQTSHNTKTKTLIFQQWTHLFAYCERKTHAINFNKKFWLSVNPSQMCFQCFDGVGWVAKSAATTTTVTTILT